MQLERARYLVSAEGREALVSVRRMDLPGDVVERAALLRRRFAPAEAAALGEQVALAARAGDRFGALARAGFLYTDEGLQMMTHPLVARRRAQRFAAPGCPVLDATCGLGGDLAAFADAGLPATGLERDAATAVLAGANVRGRALVIRGDVAALPFRIEGRSLFLDPSRRTGGGRRFDPAAYSPPWDLCLALARRARLAAVKAAPGIPDAAVPADAELEFVQLGRSLREATFWFGSGATPGLRRAVLLPGPFEMTSDEPECPGEPRPAGACIIDPHGCVTRAGLVRQLGARLGAWLLDPQVAYLSAAQAEPTPFGTVFELLEDVPFSVARLRRLLHDRDWRPDEIRRRAFPVEPDELRKLLRPRGSTPVTLLCTTIAGSRRVFVCRLAVDGTAGQ